MKKRAIKPKKLQLNRETVLHLEKNQVLAGIPLGGLITYVIDCPSMTCPPRE